MLAIGSPLPAKQLLSDTGAPVSLSDYHGHYIVLYAYPRDDTPGCSAEACSFRDQSEAIVSQGALIFGISADSVESHRAFKEKYRLNFTLLSDPDHEFLAALGAWGEKTRYGKKTVGIIRSTFLFDPEGKLIKVWNNVSPQNHGEQIAAYLQNR